MFGKHPAVVTNMSELESLTVDTSTLYFVGPTEFIEAIDYFMPRRQSVVLMSADTGRADIARIDPSTDESTMIDAIGDTLQHMAVEESQPRENLSQREIDVLRLVALGYINKEIADRLSISLNTVLSHRKNITAKLGIRSASGLSFYALMNGIIDPSTPRR
jgi:DNA-binding CsgD family transcriptional regulator